MVIQYPDGTIYTTHKDGTKFLTSADSNTITIEHNGNWTFYKNIMYFRFCNSKGEIWSS